MTRLIKLIQSFTSPAVLDNAPPSTAEPANTRTAEVSATHRPERLRRPDGASASGAATFSFGAARTSVPAVVDSHVAVDNALGALMRRELANWLTASPPDEMSAQRSMAESIQTAFDENSRCLDLRFIQVTSLPNCLEHLHAVTSIDGGQNQITVLPCLPEKLVELRMVNAGLTALPPSLPPELTELDVSSNSLRRLPELPASLQMLSADNNALEKLPVLPDSLISLSMPNNCLSKLPSLPKKLDYLNVKNNLLEEFPTLPPGLVRFIPAGNPARLLPPIPKSIVVLAADKDQFEATIDSLKKEVALLTTSLQSQQPLAEARLTGRKPQLERIGFAATGDLRNRPGDLLRQIVAQFVPGSADTANLATTTRNVNEKLRDRAAIDGMITELQEQIGILETHMKIQAQSGQSTLD
ncbi:MAG: hypothetical protein V4695_08200 [Pseudomonadota bacterium]